MPKTTTYIIVLSDGETWSTANGCTLVATTEDDIERAMEQSTLPKGHVVADFDHRGNLLKGLIRYARNSGTQE